MQWKLITGLAVLAVIGGLGSFAGCEHHNAKVARAERDAVKSMLETAVDANTSNVTTIKAQAKALKAWQDLKVTPEQIADLLVSKSHFEAKSASLEKQNAALRNKDRELPECVALLRMSLQRACPGISTGLRKLQSGDQDSPGGNPHPRGEALTTGTHGGLRTQVSVSR